VKKIFKATGEIIKSCGLQIRTENRRNHSRRLEKSLKKVKKIIQAIGDIIQDYQLITQVLL